MMVKTALRVRVRQVRAIELVTFDPGEAEMDRHTLHVYATGVVPQRIVLTADHTALAEYADGAARREKDLPTLLAACDLWAP